MNNTHSIIDCVLEVVTMSNMLWVDDLRNPEEFVKGEWVWVKTSADAIKELQKNKYEVVSLDNDLGEEMEGKDIFNWIEQRLYWKDIELTKLKRIYVHSSNVGAVRYIMNARNIMRDKYKIEINIINSDILN